MRQVCNVAFVTQVDGMDEHEFTKFTRELRADPSHPVSHGAIDLMRLMRTQPRGGG